jgi:hypothetical protein
VLTIRILRPGLLKAILAVERGVIFPSLNFRNANPRLKLDTWRLKVPLATTLWTGSPTGVRRASVNSFGYGGKCAFLTSSKNTSDQQQARMLTLFWTMSGRTWPLVTQFSARKLFCQVGAVMSLIPFWIKTRCIKWNGKRRRLGARMSLCIPHPSKPHYTA